MKNKMIIAAVCVQLVGCSAWRYPNWEKVNTIISAYKKPCELRKEEVCKSGYGCQEWYQKRATIYGANTLVVNNENSTGTYFLCQSGLPLYVADPDPAWLIVNRTNPAATEADYDKAYAECSYDAHKATIDTDSPPLARAYVPTSNYDINSAQIRAIENDRIQQVYHEQDLSIARLELTNECLRVKGFEEIKSKDKQDLETLAKTCPGIDNLAMPCFVLAKKK